MRSSLVPLVAVSGVAVTSATGGGARADFIRNTTGIPSPISTITFDEHTFPRFTQITTQYLDTGVSFAPRAWYDAIVAELPNITGHRVGNSAVGELDDPMSIRFVGTRTAAAFALASNTSTMTFTALLNGQVVETAMATSNTTSDNNFYGFTNTLFDEIRITQQVSGGSPGFLIDNIQLGPVPSPSASAMVALAALAASRRRRG